MKDGAEAAKPPAPRLVQCAGQDCAERRSCIRYRTRVGAARWASFDIDRRKFKGPCPAYQAPAPITFRKH